MQRRNQFFILLVAASLVLLACDLGTLTSGKPTVVINSPPSGSQFREGEDISIQSTSTDSSGIARIELLIDGTVVRTDSTPGAQISYVLIQSWKATPGTHIVAVRAYNKANAASDPAAVSITVAASAAASTPTSVAGISTATRQPAPATVPATTAPPATCTNNAAFVTDVNVPDGTAMAPGQTFNKIWRLRNTGTCTWGSGYQFVFVSGEAMTTTTTISVPSTAAGANADLQVALTAPAALGTRTGQWRMKAPTGAFFGDTVRVVISVRGTPTATVASSATTTRTATPTNTPVACTGSAPVIASFGASSTTITAGQAVTLTWGAVTNAESATIEPDVEGIATPGSTVVTPTVTTTYTLTATGCGGTATRQVTITVSPVGPTVTYDFLVKGPDAQWVTCASGYPVVGWNGSDADNKGFVKPRPGSAMEDGASYPKLLEMHPNWDANGCISGSFSAYTVQSGDRFKAKVGFLQSASGGSVTFQLNYREGTTLSPLGSWTKAYNGNLTDLNVDLASIAGHNVQFALAVLAGPSAGQDWATWVSPRVEH